MARLYACRRIVYRLRQSIFDSIVKQEVGFFDDTRTGELTNRLSSDTQVLQNAVTVNISMLFRFLLQILGSLVVMFYLEVTLTLVLMVVVPVIVLISRQYGSVVQKLRKKYQDELAAAGTTAEEAISNIRRCSITIGWRVYVSSLRNGAHLWCGIESERSLSRESTQIVRHREETGVQQWIIHGFDWIAHRHRYFSGHVVSGIARSCGELNDDLSVVPRYGAKLVHDRELSTGLLASFMMYMLQVALAFAFLASLFGG